MTGEINVAVLEQPGQIGNRKARTIAQLIRQFYLTAPQDIRDDIDLRAEELKQKGDDDYDQSDRRLQQ